MGFFSSIGDFVSGAVDTVTDIGKGLLGVGDAASGVANVINAGSNVAAGIMSDEMAKKNLAFQKDAFNKNYKESVRQYNQNYKLAQSQDQLQRDFLKNRIRWSIQDAQKAGLHPMAALGLSSGSFSPVSTSSGSLPSVPDLSGPTYDWVADAGQSLAYASAKAKDRKQQEEAYRFQRDVNREQLHGLELDNELKVMQILSELQRLNTSGPANASVNGKNGALIEGQDDAIKIVPDQVTASDSSNPSSTAGSHPLWSHARSGDFSVPVLSGNLADAVTENKEKHLGAELGYAIGAWRGSIKRPLSAYTAEEKRKLKSGKYSDYYYPFLGWRVEPTMSWKNFLRFVLGELKDKPRNGGGGATWRDF